MASSVWLCRETCCSVDRETTASRNGNWSNRSSRSKSQTPTRTGCVLLHTYQEGPCCWAAAAAACWKCGTSTTSLPLERSEVTRAPLMPYVPTQDRSLLLPATRRWRSGCQRCGGRGENRWDGGSFVSHFSHNLSHRSVTCSLLPQKCDTEITVSKAIGVSFFFLLCHKATRQSRGEICSQKKKYLPFRFFLLPIWKCHSNVVLLGKEKQHCAWLCVCIRQKGILSCHENYCSLVSNKWKSVLLFLQTVSWTCSETCVFMHLLFEN